MANRGIGFFDSKSQYFRTAQEATISDIAALLGRMGDGDSLAPAIAKIILDKRREIEHIFRDHDDMVQGGPSDENIAVNPPACNDSALPRHSATVMACAVIGNINTTPATTSAARRNS